MINEREKKIIQISIISILTNIALTVFKGLIGFISNSIAIVLDAVNNLSDALSSIITIIGTKLAGKAPDKEHPYGHGRIEYMTSLIVSAIVIYAGITAFIESIKKIIHPQIVEYTMVTLIIVLVSIIVKFILGWYVKKRGKALNSDSLVASGADSFNDAIISISVLFSAIINIAFNISLEAYVGVLVSIVIIKAGLELIKESVDNLLGARVESKLAYEIKKEVTKEKDVYGAFDLVLNNYGPDKYLGSIHIEVLDTLSVADVDKISRRISRNVMERFGVILHTIGIYSVNTKDEKAINIRNEISKIVFSHNGILQMHGFYLNEQEKSISLDIIIDFNIKNREEVYKQIFDEIQTKYKEYKIIITLDVDITD